MKKYIVLFMIVGLVFCFGSRVLAKEGADDDVTTHDLNDDTKRESPTLPSLGGTKEMKEKRDIFRAEMKTKREDFVNKLKTERDAFKTELKTKREEFKKSTEEMKRNFCEKAKEMVAKRFEVAITMLEKIQTRVGEVLAKLKADGKDTTSAEEALELSKSKLASAKIKLQEVKALVPEGGCANMTPEVFEKIKLGAREAKDLLKESRESLREAIKEIKNY